MITKDMDRFELLDVLTRWITPEEMADYLYANDQNFTYKFITALEQVLVDDRMKDYDSYEEYKSAQKEKEIA